jgi:hypothetical protein
MIAAHARKRSCLFPPPALSERRHRYLATLGMAVCGRAAFMVREDQRPHPRASYGRGVGIEDSADSFTMGQHIERPMRVSE